MLFCVALRGIDSEILKAAQIDGASAYATYRRIIIPMIRPAFMSALIILTHMAHQVFMTWSCPSPARIRAASRSSPQPSCTLYTFTRNQMGAGSASAVIMLMTIAAIMIPYSSIPSLEEKN